MFTSQDIQGGNGISSFEKLDKPTCFLQNFTMHVPWRSVVNVREEVVHMMWAFRDYTTVALVCATPHESNQLVTFTWWQWDRIQSNPRQMNNTCKHSLCDSPGDSYEMFKHLSSRPGAIADRPAMACSFLTVPRMVVINKRISSSAERLGRVWELSEEPLRLMYHHCLTAHSEWITNQLFSSLSKSEQLGIVSERMPWLQRGRCLCTCVVKGAFVFWTRLLNLEQRKSWESKRWSDSRRPKKSKSFSQKQSSAKRLIFNAQGIQMIR